MGKAGGVEIRARSIRVHFTYRGKPCRETVVTDGIPMPPTPANIKYAQRLVAEIKDKIRLGVFSFSDYFPASKKATTGHATTVGDQLESWIKVQSSLADSTIKSYRITINFWKGQIGEKPLNRLKHSDILAALSTQPKWTGKTRNNKVSVLRQALALSVRDELIKGNPADGLESASHQKEPPDPFSMDEADSILAHMRVKYGQQIADYFEFKFYTGLRTGESLAVRWQDVDLSRRQLMVSSTITLGQHKNTTKTSSVRVVEINGRAMAVLERARALTQLLPDGWVFRCPATNERWGDESTLRKSYWTSTLRKLGIRYRGPYNTRHTYATVMLMSGVTPAYAAKQMGHSIEMFLRTYSKWIDTGQNALEMGKIERMIFPRNSPKTSTTR